MVPSGDIADHDTHIHDEKFTEMLASLRRLQSAAGARTRIDRHEAPSRVRRSVPGRVAGPVPGSSRSEHHRAAGSNVRSYLTLVPASGTQIKSAAMVPIQPRVHVGFGFVCRERGPAADARR